MWIGLACLSALFAGVTAVLAKIGLKNVDSSLATALRTIIVLIFSWIMVLFAGTQEQLKYIDSNTVLVLCFSGIATGLSWLCYFKALQLGDVNKVTPIDKSSTILTMLLAFIFFDEKITMLKIISMIIMSLGTYMMIEKKQVVNKVTNNHWLLFALASALFASLTAIIAKIAMLNIDSNLGTFIRTAVVLIMAWGIVFYQQRYHTIKEITKKNWLFLFSSGITTGLSWICYYKALQLGEASIVVPIDKLSIIVTIIFSYFVLKESLSKKAVAGLILIVAGTMLLLI